MSESTFDTILIYNPEGNEREQLTRFIRSCEVYCEVVFNPKEVDHAVGLIEVSDIPSLKEGITIPYLNVSPHHIDESQVKEFLFEVCKAQRTWSVENIITDQIRQLQTQLGKHNVLCGLSGGVDSSVTAALLQKAVGKQVHLMFVNTGLLRKGEVEEVHSLFGGENFHYIDAQKEFLSSLKDVTDPEKKRKIIGALFIEIFEREAKKLNNITFLAQGTLYPDVIESLQHQDGSSVAVKSHHNVGGLPEKMNMVLVEPLKQLFKDEVRLVGRALGLPAEVVDRHPFPGPGLGVRCIGAITPERLETLREVDAIFIKELRKENLYDQIWQALATLLPVKSVGLRDGRRNYQEVCTIRAITSVDAMSATTYPFTHQFLQHLSEKIVREVPLVSRVLYDITDKPPATIEWE